MKSNLRVYVLCACLFVILGCSAKSFAQTPPIVGGYGKASVSDKKVVAAANFAVKKRGKTQNAVINLISIRQAKTQIVAGLNYKVCMEVSVKKSGRKGFRQFVSAVVYKNLKNIYSLTSWTILKDASECSM